jgi:hypothetical protein
VGVLKVVAIVLRPVVVCRFDMSIIGVLGLHVGILARHASVRETENEISCTRRRAGARHDDMNGVPRK